MKAWIFVLTTFTTLFATNHIKEQQVTFGKQVEIAISVADLQKGVSFYKSLDFKTCETATFDYQAQSLTDGNIVITLHQQDFPSPGLYYFGSNVAEVYAELKDQTEAKVVILKGSGDAPQQIRFQAPDGGVYFLDQREPVQREGVSFEMLNPAVTLGGEKHFSKLGMFGEFSRPTEDRGAVAQFFSQFGFKKMHESNAPYPWGIYGDGQAILGVHQTTEFSGAGITFFSKDAGQRIKTLKAQDFDFAVILDDNNAVLNGVSGEKLFIFHLP